MSRIFNRQWRITLVDKSDAELFTPEVEYYSKHNRYPVTLFGKEITNIYKRINVQIFLTKVCNLCCPFCIENDRVGGLGKNEKDWLYLLVKQTLEQYLKQGIIPNVSITGGEPTLFPERLYHLLDLVGSFVGGTNGIKYVNVNSNGTDLSVPYTFPWLRTNISRHHYDPDANREIFGKDYHRLNTDEIEKASMQCVLMKGYIDSVEGMKEYMRKFAFAQGFSFRGLTTLDAKKGYDNEVKFTNERYIDIKPILDAIANDPEFEFLQQKVGDHYIYELYKYRGKVFRLVYSNFAWLRQVETEERSKGIVNSRATIIHPNKVYSGWTYDLNLIHAIT